MRRRADLAARRAVPVDTIDTVCRRLAARGLARADSDGGMALTGDGRTALQKMVDGFRALLTKAVARWSPEEHAEVRTMRTDFARHLVSERPQASSRGQRHARAGPAA